MIKEFSLFEANASSPIVDWLRALCVDIVKTDNVKGVGVIGMWLSGNSAISLMADENVLAAVSSQPPMPLGKDKALHMSAGEIESVKRRLDEHGPMKM